MSKDNSGSITDARERLARTISGEFAREDTLIWRLSVGTVIFLIFMWKDLINDR